MSGPLPPNKGLTAAAAGQQSESVRGRVGLGAAATGEFDAELYGAPGDHEEKASRYATEIGVDEEEDAMDGGGSTRAKSSYQSAQDELALSRVGDSDLNPFEAHRREGRVTDRDTEYTKRRFERQAQLSPERADPFAEETNAKPTKKQPAKKRKAKDGAATTAEEEEATPQADAPSSSATSYKDILAKHQFERDQAEVMRNIKKKAQEDAESNSASAAAGDSTSVTAPPADSMRKRRRFEDGVSGGKTAGDMPDTAAAQTGILLDDSENWAAMPAPRQDDDEEDEEDGFEPSNGTGPARELSAWEATPQIIEAQPARKARSRWDATPVSAALAGDATPMHPGAGDATPMYSGAGGETPTAKKRSRWGETPMAASLASGADKPTAAAAGGFQAGSAMATPMHMTSSQWQAHLASMTPEQLHSLRADADIAERNRPLSDEDLDAMLPGEADGFRVVRPPDGYQPAVRTERQMLMTPTPLGQEGFFIPADTPGIRYDVPSVPADSGLPAFQKEEDAKYFGALLEEVDEKRLSKAELKERTIMKLLLKIKNGTAPQRKSALKMITDKARDFGAAPLFDQILPLLMSPTLEDGERHVLVKVIDRVLYKLDDLVRPYVHKILIVIEPMLIEDDYYARVEGREIISNLAKAAGLATMIATMRPDLDNADEYVRNCSARAFAVVASALGVHSLLPFLKAVCQSKKSWEARHTGIKIVQQIAILTGCAVLSHLKSLVEIVEHGLTDEQSKVRCIAALALAALAEAAHPYGIESFDSVLRPLWLGTRQHRGKCWGAGTLMLMYDGSTKAVEDIVRDANEGIDQQLMGDDNTPRRVIPGSTTVGHTADDAEAWQQQADHPHGGPPATYLIKYDQQLDAEWTCNDAHILVVRLNVRPEKVWSAASDAWMTCSVELSEPGVPRTVYRTQASEKAADEALATMTAAWTPLEVECSVTQFLSWEAHLQSRALMFQPAAVQFSSSTVSLQTRLEQHFGRPMTEQDVAETAWVLGMWLTNGSARPTQAATRRLEAWGHSMHCIPAASAVDETIEAEDDTAEAFLNSTMYPLLKSYNLLGQKHVPLDLIREQPEVRMALVAGLVDGGGRYHDADHRYVLASKEKELLVGIVQLTRSLGYSPEEVTSQKADEYTTSLDADDLHLVPTCLVHQHKRGSPRENRREYGFSLTQVAHASYYGFALDGNNRCLFANFVVTHNTLAAFLKAIGYIIPLMDDTYCNYYTKEVMVILIREFATPDEEMKKIVLKVIKQCVQTSGVEPDYIRKDILPEFFKHFWVRRMALDKRNYAELVSTTESLAHKVGGGEIIARIVDDLKDESEPYRKMVMETIEKILASQGAMDIDGKLESQLVDGALYAFQEQTTEDTKTMLNGFGVIINALGQRARAYLPQIAGILKWRLNNKLPRVRQQAADLIARIAVVLKTCNEVALMQHLGVVLYEYLGEEYPDVLASILGALKAIVNVIGMQDMTPPIADLLPRLTPILRNRHERVQETTIDLVGRIADRGAEFVSAKEWMRISFELLELLKAHKKGIRRATVGTFGFIARAIGPHDVLATLLNNLKVQERQNRVCTTVAIAIVAETCAPFTVLPALMNEYRVPELNVQNGVLKALSFLFEYIGEVGKDFCYCLLPLLEDALMDRDMVHRQTAASVVKHMSLGVQGLSREDAMAHLLNYVWPNIFETSPHLINAVTEAIEGLRTALGPTKILQYLLQGLFHPARKVRTVFWRIYNTVYISCQDALVPAYPRLTDAKDEQFRRWELEQFL